MFEELFDVSEEEELRSFCERTGLSQGDIPRSPSGGKGKEEGEDSLRRGSSLSSLSIATTPDPHSPHSTSDDFGDGDYERPSGLSAKIPIRAKAPVLGGSAPTAPFPLPHAAAPQASPVTSEDSGTKTASDSSSPATARQKSATPDLLKGRTRPPYTSPASSQDDPTLRDPCSSNSDEDHPDGQGDAAHVDDADAGLEGEGTPRRKPRFERARPIRRNSRPRNYTTSIFVSPSKFEGGGSGRRRSVEEPALEAPPRPLSQSQSTPTPLSLLLDSSPTVAATSVTADGDSVQILLSAAGPEELSYV